MAEDTTKQTELKKLQERARAAREMRRKAPATTATGAVTIPQKDIINRISRSEGGQDAKWHYSFQDRRDGDSLVDRGYEPAIDPETREWVEYLGDPCWKLPVKDFIQIQQENTAHSAAMLGDKTKVDSAKTGESMTVEKMNL